MSRKQDFIMHFEFKKAVQFSLLIKAGGRLREFNFRKLKSPDEELFSVDVCNERGDRIIFNMHKADNDWEMTENNLPKWITESKITIRHAVDEELKNWR